MNQPKRIASLPIYHYSLVLYREFIVRYKSELEKEQKLFNLVSDSEKFVLATLDILQNINTTLENLDMAYEFICNGYNALENISIESYNYDLYHLDVFNNKIATLQNLIYKLVSLVYKLPEWIRAINKPNNSTGVKFNFNFIRQHKEEVRNKLNNDCLFSLLLSDLNTHFKPIIYFRNKSSHDGEIDDYSYDGTAVGLLMGIEKGIMNFDNIKTLRYVAKAMVDGHQKLMADMKIHMENAYELSRRVLCALSDRYIKIICSSMYEKYPQALTRLTSKQYGCDTTTTVFQ